MKKFVLSILLPLLIPVVCFIFVWNVGGDGHVKLPPYYVVDSVVANAKSKSGFDTIYHKAADLQFVNQLGDSISINTKFKNKIVVFNLFNLQDTTVGLQLNKNMQFLQKVYKKNDDTIAFLSLATNIPTASVQDLRNYANALNANHDKWYFGLSASQKLLPYLQNQIQVPGLDTSFKTPCNKFILLDKDRNIRGYFNALDTFQIRDCADAISLLILEKKRKRK